MKKAKYIITVFLILTVLTGCGNTVSEDVKGEYDDIYSITTAERYASTIDTFNPTSSTTQALLSINNRETEPSSLQSTVTVPSTAVVSPSPTSAPTATIAHSTEKYTATQSTVNHIKTTKPTEAVTATKAVTTSKAPVTTTKPTTKPATTKAITTKPSVSSAKNTTAPSTTKAPKKTQVCYVTIVCTTINDNLNKLKPAKASFVPSDGIILKEAIVELNGSQTAFDVIKTACSENSCRSNCAYCQNSGIQIEYTYTPAFDNYYIEGIHQIYEKDCGSQSGWMYSVNGIFPNVGVSAYNISNGDRIVFAYTCNMGEDVGNAY